MFKEVKRMGILRRMSFVFSFLVFIISLSVLSSNLVVHVEPLEIENGTNSLFNITIQNLNVSDNITQINITLPSEITFSSPSSNGSSVYDSQFSNDSSTLYWNKNPLILSDEIECFWFNATPSYPGQIHFNVSVLYSSGEVLSNITNEISITQTLSKCGALNIPNITYKMNQSVFSNDSCLYINADNITLDCADNWINFGENGSENSIYGIYVSGRRNIVIKNCNIFETNRTSVAAWRNAIYIYNSQNCSVINTFTNSSVSGGIRSYNSDYLSLEGISSHSKSATAIYISGKNDLVNNSLGESFDGRGIDNVGDYNVFVNSIGISLGAGYGISIGGLKNTLVNVTGKGNSSSGIRIVSENSTFNKINGTSSSGRGISLENSRNNITNSYAFSSEDHGLYILYSENNVLDNLTLISLTHAGTYFLGSSNNIVKNSNLIGALALAGDSYWNLITNVTTSPNHISGNGADIYSSENNFSKCIFNGTLQGVSIQGNKNYFKDTLIISNTSLGYNAALYITGGQNNTFVNTSAIGTYYGDGIYVVSGDNNKIINSTGRSENGEGITIKANRTYIDNSEFHSNNSYALSVMINSIEGEIFSSKLHSNYSTVFSLYGESYTIENNTLISDDVSSSNLIYLSSSSKNNTLYHNNFTETSGYYIDNANETNKFYTTINGVKQGNYYYGIENLEIWDYDENWWADYGKDYPLNSSWSKWSGYGEDPAPYTPKGKKAGASILILSPSSTTYFTSQLILVNFTASDREGISNLFYNNGTSNITFSSAEWYNFSQGSHNLTFYVNDSFGDLTKKIINFTIESLNSNQIIANDSEIQVDSSINEIIVPVNQTIENITIPQEVDEATLDLSQKLNSENELTLDSNLTIEKEDETQVIIHENTTISGENWTGDFILPKITEETSESKTILIGSENRINLSKPAKIVIKGKAGYKAKWSEDGLTYHEITTYCDNHEFTPTNLISECYTNDSTNKDLIIWSNHFTYFKTYLTTSSEKTTITNYVGKWLRSDKITEEDLKKGITKKFFRRERLKVQIGENLYSIGLYKMNGTQAIVRIEVGDIDFKTTLLKNQSKEVDINNDSVKDFYIRLNDMNSLKANLTIKLIDKKELETEKQESVEKKEETEKEEVPVEEKYNLWIWIISSLIGVGIVYLLLRRFLLKN